MTGKPPRRRTGIAVCRPAEVRSPRTLRAHPQAALIPPMTAEEVKGFEADIGRRGVEVPIEITTAGVILDGHHRHRAALALGLEAVPVRVVNPKDEVDYMYSAAIQRRQLGKSQRAALAVMHGDYLATREAAARCKTRNLRNGSVDVADLPHRGGRSRAVAAELAVASERLIQNVIKVQNHDPALFQQLLSGEVSANRALRQIEREKRYAQIVLAPPLPGGVFDLVYADPPWQSESPSSDHSPEQHYPTMPTAEIAQLAVPSANDAVLFLWAITGRLPDAFEVISSWGFTQKSCLIWDKLSPGLGNYARNQHEYLLIATKGKVPLPLPEWRPASIVRVKRRRHSEKPPVFYELIERMYPGTTRLELFARGELRPDWTAWGNEVGP